MENSQEEKQINIVFSADDYLLLKKACKLRSIKITPFIRSNVIENSRRILKELN